MADISKITLPDGVTYNLVGTDTKNTAGSTNNTGKLFLVGALEQSANPQTYSNSNCYIDSHNIYTRGFRVRVNDTVVGEMGHANDAGALLVNDSTGGYSVWMRGDTGQISSKIQNVVENVSGAWKRRVRNEVDTTNHYGKTTWYYGDNYPTVEITGEGNISSYTWSVKNGNYYSRAECYIDAEDRGRINVYDENGIGRIMLLGAIGIILNDENDDQTIRMDSSSGKITCNSMSVQNISDSFTITKSSGNWSVNEVTAYKSGNTVQLTIAFKGNGQAVSAGSNAFVGTVADGEFPVGLIRLVGNGGSSIVMGYIQPSGEMQIKVLVASYTLASSGVFSVMGTYIAKDI